MTKIYIGLIILILLPFKTFAQTYINSKSAYYGKNDLEQLSTQPKINEITLTENHQFEFWSRPMVSCLTWHNLKETGN